MTRIATVLDEHRDRIVQRFVERFQTMLPGGASFDELGPSAHALLADLSSQLRDPALPSTSASTSPRLGTSLSLPRIGHELGALLHAYGVLDDVVFEVLSEQGPVEVHEGRVLARLLHGAAVDAATADARLRDRALREQAEQHLGFIAHDLRTPLGSMKLALEVGRLTGALPDNKVVSGLARSVSRLGMLIDNTLVAARLFRGALAPRQVNLQTLLHDVAADHGLHADAKALRTEIDVADDVTVWADEQVLRLVLSNLLQNAVKFSQKGGAIAVRLRSSPGHAVVDVQDCCGGLTPSVLAKVSDPGPPDHTGFGPGLQVAREAARALGGTIHVEDRPGSGCVFSLELPVASERASAS